MALKFPNDLFFGAEGYGPVSYSDRGIIWGSGSPNGQVVANVGAMYADVSSGIIYAKTTSADANNWVALSSSSGAGTVTSVAVTASPVLTVSGSPITSAGTIDIEFAGEPAGTVFAGPVAGANAAPTFRDLALTDLPSISPADLNTAGYASGQVPAYNSGLGTFQPSTPTSGTVTSVGLAAPGIFTVSGSPITSSGTLTFSLNTETANTFFAGPVSGGAATPTFRAITSADLPSGIGTVTSVALALPTSVFSISGSPVTTSGTLTGAFISQSANLVFASPNGSSGIPTFRALASSDLPAGTGTVTSVALGAPSGIFTVSGSPVTTSGTLTLTEVSQTANTVWAGPVSGGSAAPTFRALNSADLPSGTGTVTSVGLALPSSVFTISGSPVTTSGTLTGAFVTQPPNVFFGGPVSGSLAAPDFRFLIANDIPFVLNSSNITDPTTASLELQVSASPDYIIADLGGTQFHISDQAAGSVILMAVTSTKAVTINNGGNSILLDTPTTLNGSLYLNGVSAATPGGTGGLLFTKLSDGNLYYYNSSTTVTSQITPGTSGTVTSVGMTVPSIFSVSGSPITTSGTLGLTLNTESAHLVLAGPASGSAATPTFRALTSADLPAGTGTVTSVALALPTSVFTISGSPVTTSGTLTGAFSTQTANFGFMGPVSGSAAVPTFRAFVANDIPGTLNKTIFSAGGGAQVSVQTLTGNNGTYTIQIGSTFYYQIGMDSTANMNWFEQDVANNITFVQYLTSNKNYYINVPLNVAGQLFVSATTSGGDEYAVVSNNSTTTTGATTASVYMETGSSGSTSNYGLHARGDGYFTLYDQKAGHEIFNVIPVTGSVSFDFSMAIGAAGAAPSVGGTGVNILAANTSTNSTMLSIEGDLNAQGGFKQQVYMGFINAGSNGSEVWFSLNSTAPAGATSRLSVGVGWTAPAQGSVLKLNLQASASTSTTVTFKIYANGSIVSTVTQAITASWLPYNINIGAKDAIVFAPDVQVAVSATTSGAGVTVNASCFLTVEC